MSSNRLKIAIFAALFFGFIAAYGIYNFVLQQREATKALRLATQDVVVATKEILPGATISTEMVKTVSWPKNSLPVGYFAAPKEAVGKVVMTKTLAGEPVTKSKLTGAGAGLTVRLTPGHRAMAVKVDEIVGVSGFIAPNDRVDVITTVEAPGKKSRNQKVSKIILQNKRVLSVAQKIEREKGEPKVVRSITLEVTPEEGEKLTLASLQGKVILALRPVGDQILVRTRGSTMRDLLGLAQARRKPTSNGRKDDAPRQKYKVEVYMGNQKTVQEF